MQGYTLIGTVGADVRAYTDAQRFPQGGWFSYVVVAFDANGNSIPKAEAKALFPGCGPPPDRDHDPSIICPGNPYTVIVDGGEEVVHYEWQTENKPSYIQMFSSDSCVAVFNNTYISGPIDTTVFKIFCIEKNAAYGTVRIDTIIPVVSTVPCSQDSLLVFQSPLPVCKGGVTTIGTNETEPATFKWQIYNTPSYISVSADTLPTLTILNNATSTSAIDTVNAFSLRCIVTTLGGSDTSSMFYPELSLDSCSNGVYVPPPIIQPSSVHNVLAPVIGIFRASPNPSSSMASIEYTLASSAIVNLIVYDVLGSPVADLVSSEIQSPGRYNYEFNASDLPEGSYICSLRTAHGEVKSIKLIIQR